MPNFSICMIVRNEALFLEKMMQNIAHLTDDIVLVDTGSNDATLDIAKRFHCHIHHCGWEHDFSAARNISLNHARHEWVLVLDADELLSDDLKYWLIAFKQSQGSGLAVCIPTFNFFKERIDIPGLQEIEQDTFLPSRYYVVSKKVRLFPRRKGIVFEGLVHETVENALKSQGVGILSINHPIWHLGYLNRTPSEMKHKARVYLNMAKEKFLKDTTCLKHRFDYAYQLYLCHEKKSAYDEFRCIKRQNNKDYPAVDYFLWERHFERFPHSRYLKKDLPVQPSHPYIFDIQFLKLKCLLKNSEWVLAMKDIRFLTRMFPGNPVLKKLCVYVSHKLGNQDFLKNMIEPGIK